MVIEYMIEEIEIVIVNAETRVNLLPWMDRYTYM